MARVTVEDCIDKVDSPYELVLVAKERATQLNTGIEPTLDKDNDKNTVIALREIAINKKVIEEVFEKKKHEKDRRIVTRKANLNILISSIFFPTQINKKLLSKVADA